MNTEFSFIDKLKKRYNLAKIGDDAAVLPKDERTDLVISADLLIEDIDFRLDWTTPEFIGHKSLAVSVSDIAAMGAEPCWSLISIGLPENLWKTDFADKFYESYMRMAENCGVELVGGDISKTPEKIVIDSIVLGQVAKGKAVRRSGAEPGDLIFVTGELGGAAAGLILLENNIRHRYDMPLWQNGLIERQLFPCPHKSSAFAEFATSMIDLSDGLSSDLSHICRASGVGAKIFADKIPVHRKLKHLSAENRKKFLSENLDFLDLALHGGEDFELLFTVRPENLAEFQKKFPNRFTILGEITENVGKIELIRDGKNEILEPKGYVHF
jgi:thiamine-monophosphate kinase